MLLDESIGWFVYYEIDEAAETNVITPLANAFRNSNYDIKTMMETLLKSEHFYDVANRGAIIKSPVDFMVGIMRQYDISSNSDFPGSSDYKDQYYMWYLLQYFLLYTATEHRRSPKCGGLACILSDSQLP